MAIYTKLGDQGKTCLIGNNRKYKDDLALCACGDIDELSSYIGVIIATTEYFDRLRVVQKELSVIMAFIAEADLNFKEDSVVRLEKEIDDMENNLPKIRSFVFSGSNLASANLDFARAICRRAERSLVRFEREAKLDCSICKKYMNRLSDWLFIFARYLENRK